MKTSVFYCAGAGSALSYAKKILMQHQIIFSEQPDSSVTHLLLGAPAFEADGSLKGGGCLEDILSKLPPDITVLGGNLQHPALAGYHTIDLLQDPFYLAENADITAHCAVKIAGNRLPIIWKNCPVLIIGWGRIGKCLARLLRSMGARVTVGARKPADRAMLEALGYETLDSTCLGYELIRFRVIFNTVPIPVISRQTGQYCREDCLKVDLASILGIDAQDVVWARGLPSKEAPETSGYLIARTVLYRYQEGV